MLGALPRAQRALGHTVRVLSPLYRCVDRAPLTRVGPDLYAADDAWFVAAPSYYDRDALYGERDDPLRFAHLCRAAARMAHDFDVVHLHDWQAALTAVYLQGQRPTVFTIHNLAYQGLCGFEWADVLEIPEPLRRFDGIEFHGQMALIKAGLVRADWITTVSPSYAREIMDEPAGCGLSGLLRWRRARLSGILNGLDPRDWPPPLEPLPREGTHFVVVSRAVPQKGLDLVVEAASAVVEAGARLTILARGEPEIERQLEACAARFAGQVQVELGFDLERARQLYASADFVLVPSRYEPCGLTQLIAMRYGAIPIVRRTGGLADTVEDGVTGISFDAPTGEALAAAIRRAVNLSAAARMRLRANARSRDWSWRRAAQDYLNLYRDLQETR